MNSTIRIGKGLLPVLILGLAVGFLFSFGCESSEDDGSDVNHAPVLDPIGNKAVDFGDNLSFTVTASDPDGDVLIFSTTNLPPGATFAPATQSFSWTTTPGYNKAGTYDVTFSVSDGELSDDETITITVNRVEATGTAYTGVYPTIASNFEGNCSITCVEKYSFPAPDCEEFYLFLLQNDDRVLCMGTGLIYNDGSFSTSGSYNFGDSITIETTVTGDISANKIEGSFYMDNFCNWSFDFSGPIPDYNATVTVNGFTGHDGENVYAFVIDTLVIDLYGPVTVTVAVAVGGGDLADGSVVIQLKPELADGEYELWVILDADGNIHEEELPLMIFDMPPVSVGDWYLDDYILEIDGGSGSVTLDKNDFIEELP